MRKSLEKKIYFAICPPKSKFYIPCLPMLCTTQALHSAMVGWYCDAPELLSLHVAKGIHSCLRNNLFLFHALCLTKIS